MVGRDYRIGLIAGLVLAGGALVWVATRPSLGPRLPLAPSSGQNDLGTDRLASLPPASSSSETGKSGGRQTVDGKQTTDRRTNPSSIIQNPSSGSPAPTAPGTTGPAQTPRIHVVRPGETLSTIAQQYYGTTNGWRKILTANDKTIKDANKVPVGTKLIIP